jgi:hypothetical protein
VRRCRDLVDSIHLAASEERKQHALETTGTVYVTRGGGEVSSQEVAMAHGQDIDFGRRSNAVGSTKMRNKR